jgi:hypothetical protein
MYSICGQRDVTMSNGKAESVKNEQLSYLLDVYKLYHGHINTMFNYFMIIAGLTGNAYINSLPKKPGGDTNLAIWIALFGALISLVSLLVHIRSRDMLDTIESGLRREEDKLFPDKDGFLNAAPTRTWFLFRHKYQFPITYWAFVIGFVGMALYADKAWVDSVLLRYF